jgi:hypothetical protein
LPAPEGDDSTSISPRRRIVGSLCPRDAVMLRPVAVALRNDRSINQRTVDPASFLRLEWLLIN